jgi:DNA transformation protein
MPMTPAAAERFTQLLNAALPCRIKKMFGGLGVYVDDVFMAVADDDRLYFKVDSETVGWYDALGMEPWILDGKPGPYREVPANTLESPEKLSAKMEEARDAALRLKAKPATSSRSRKGSSGKL